MSRVSGPGDGAEGRGQPPWAIRLASLAAVLVLAKVAVLLLRVADGGGRGLSSVWLPIAMLHDDVRALVLIAGVDALATGASAAVARRRPIADKVGWVVYGLLAAYAAFNVPVARVLSTPLTYSLLTAAGGALADSIRVYVNASNVAALGVLGAAASLLPRAVSRVAATGAARKLALGLAAFGGLLLLSGSAAERRVESAGLFRDAWATLARTSLARVSAPRSAPDAQAPPFAPAGRALDLSHLAGAARGRNVLWIILESTGARYLAPYGAPRDPTPNLTRLAREALVFDAVSAAVPESIKGFFSQICATHPAPHASASAHAESRVPCGAIGQQLSQAGYRTGLFHSGRFVYLGMADVLRDRGFAVALDAGDIGGPYASSFGTDDAATVERLLAELDRGRDDRPFFFVYMPIAGHHPYHSPGKGPRPFPETSEQDAYENDLFAGDFAMGRLLDGLRSRGVWDRTLVVVNGDHGQAFHQHEGNFAHSLFVYEENLHVPLVIAAPGLVGASVRAPQIGSLVDVAPTILELVGVAPPARWQGRSLLGGSPRVARFFTDHTLYQIGLRDGPWKLIHEVETGRSRLFALDRDPLERENLADAEPARVARYRDHAVAWAAGQQATIAHYRESAASP